MIYIGDVEEVLPTLGAETVQMVFTSPPYFGARDYGTPGELGQEATVGEYVDRVVRIFEEVKRVLRPNGTVWLNLGTGTKTRTCWGFRGGWCLRYRRRGGF